MPELDLYDELRKLISLLDCGKILSVVENRRSIPAAGAGFVADAA